MKHSHFILKNFLFVMAGIILALPLLLASESQAVDSTKTAFAATVITSRYITIPVGTIVAWPQTAALPTDADPKWRECDGRSIPTNSDLYQQKGMSITPNLYAANDGRGYFLRANGTPRQTQLDQLRSHNHEQPEHTHEVDTQLTSTAVTGNVVNPATEGKLNDTSVSGIAAGQSYTDEHTAIDTSASGFSPIVNWRSVSSNNTTSAGSHNHTIYVIDGVGGFTSFDGSHTHSFDTLNYYAGPDVRTRTAKDSVLKNAKVVSEKTSGKLINSSTSGNVVNGHSSGEAHLSGGDPTYYTSMLGSSRSNTTSQINTTETAPTYYTTRYFIRIND